MMDFWPEHQGQSPLYAKFGTVPGRNCTHNYHDRHQATHYPLYYDEQQDQGRDSSYWTVPGSRTGGAPQDYTNWTDPELSAPAPSHFPFILDRHTQQHQDLGEYQSHEARSREWTAAQRAAREYERGFLREGWQRRWEPCSPVRYSREVSTKRSDSSYRELEAWAARYSHSLPRRRRIEAELRGASQGLLESGRAPERDSRSGTDLQVAALQQVRQSANLRESGVWDRVGRQHPPTYYPPQAPAPDTSHMLDIKEKASYQRRMFSQPPGYIAPPPYNSPHKSSPVMHHCDTSWEREGKRQTYWSQPTLRKQEVPVDLQDTRRGGNKDFTKPDGNKTCAELDRLKPSGPETYVPQAGSPVGVQNTQSAHAQHECALSPQQPQTVHAVQNTVTNEQTSSKVIEGRKFRLNKKTGGLTIFCLVSRIAGTTESPSLPLCTSQTNIQGGLELGEVSKGLRGSGDGYQTQKLADEVDFRAPALTEETNASDAGNLNAKEEETPPCVESEMLGENLSNKAEADVVYTERANLNDANSTSGKQVAQSAQPMSVKYPLWREPSFTSRAETETSSTVLKENTEEGESESPRNQEEAAAVQPANEEAGSLDVEDDAQSEDSKDLLAIDTACVVVKMELIPSPKKEHVHYIGSTPPPEDSPLDVQSGTSLDSNAQLNQDVIPDVETYPLQINDRPETELDSDLGEKREPDGGGGRSSLCMPSFSISEKETLEERAERILGIPLHDCITEQQPADEAPDATSILDLCVEERVEEVEPSPARTQEDTTGEGLSQIHLDVGQTEDVVCLKGSDDAEDQVENEGAAGTQELVSSISEEDSHLKMSQDTKIAQDNLLEPTSEEGTTEQSQEVNQPVEYDTSCQCPTEDLSNSSLLSDPSLTSISFISQSNTEESLDPQLAALDTAANLAPDPDTSSLPPEPFPSSTPDTHHSPSPPPPLELIEQMAETKSSTEDQDEEGEMSQLINNDFSDTFEDLKDQEVLSQQQFEHDQPESAACAEEINVSEEQQTKEDDGDPTELLEPTPEIHRENAIDVDISQQQLECVQTEDAACVKESFMTEEHLQQEISKDPSADLLEMTISQENVTDTKVGVKILPPQFDNGQEEDARNGEESFMTEEQPQNDISEDTGLSVQTEISKENVTDSRAEVEILQEQLCYGQEEDVSCVMDSHVTEEPSQTDADEDPAGLLEQTISQENAADCQSQIEIEILQNTEPQTEPSISPSPTPSNSNCEVSQSPLDVLSPSDLASPPQASHNSDMEPVSHLETYSASTSTRPPEGGEAVSLDFPHKEEPQYPKSLWDAVNRIRKHTAPDSENEEEELNEQWDPESVGDDLGCPGVILDMNSERIVFDEAGQYKVSTESVEGAEQRPCREEPSGRAEEDALSCSSTSSHSSGDTVIVAEDEEVEGETSPNAVTETLAATGEQFPTADGERRCSGEVKGATKEEGEDELVDGGDTKEFCLTEERTAEVAVKMTTETKQKENEEDGVAPSEVAAASDEVTG